MEIQQLKSDVVDKIAAGEVVERPSHLLKELLENSIDAGATELNIEVDNGGKTISVTDNGKGVVPEELPLVFARHATSKIRESEDLWNLSSFGFRGEALASISSVSSMSFKSKRKGSKKAFEIKCDYGDVGEVLETSHPQGTEVHVDDLFGNIPARLKFLKSDSAEITQIKNVVKAIGLQYPHIEIKFKSKGQLVYLWKAKENLIDRVQEVLETKKLYQSTYEYEGFKSHVVFSDPSNVVKVSRQIWTFVQNRWVQDRGLQAAVMEAYRSLLMHGQYPICYVSVECPPDEVDVNIHPTKSQVKFVDAKKAFRVVHYALREAIEKAPWHEGKTQEVSFQWKPVQSEPQNESFNDSAFASTQFQKKSFPEKDNSPKPSFEQLQQAGDRSSETSSMEMVSSNSPATPMNFYKESAEEKSQSQSGFWSQLQVVGQVDLTYIVAQTGDKMYLVDQHAAHERVAFERLMKSWKSGNMEIQPMLLPITIDLEEPEVESLLSVSDELSNMGIQIEQEGPASLAISSMPSMISEKGMIEALKKLADEISQKGGSFALETAIADIFATMACHSVVRAGQSLSQTEMEQLLKDMDEFPLSGFCPHGRSVSIDFSFAQLEKDFGRRV